MLERIVLCVTLASAANTVACGVPIKTHPSNPHYYLYQGRPIILITSAEHYGAVINKDFDYVAYFDALQAYQLNYTRIYPGAMFEPVGKFMAGNTLGPRPQSLIVPWARSATPGYRLGGNRFDLDRWDPGYCARLKDFVTQAGRRGIMVEVCFFNSQYADTWPLSPLYSENNVQGVGQCDWRDAQTLRHTNLVRRQDDCVRKLTQEVNAFDNVILEICDEPGHIGTGFEPAGPWVSHLADVVRDAERDLPQKHLLGQEVDGPLGGPIDFAADPRFSVIIGQYIWGDDRGEMGGMKGLDYKYRDNKPLELNETAYYPLWHQGDKIADARVEAWEFIVGGGAAFNQLNGLFTADNPAGKSPDNDEMLRALENLKQFMYSFEFVKMAPDKGFLVSGATAPQYHRAISESGKQYALYIHHSSEKIGGAYTVVPGPYQENLVVAVAAGHYRVDWVDPATGSILGSLDLVHEGGQRTLATPTYKIDIALRVKHLCVDGARCGMADGKEAGHETAPVCVECCDDRRRSLGAGGRRLPAGDLKSAGGGVPPGPFGLAGYVSGQCAQCEESRGDPGR
jgi:hypothetical protein